MFEREFIEIREARLREGFSSESLCLSSESSRYCVSQRCESRSSLEHSRNALETRSKKMYSFRWTVLYSSVNIFAKHSWQVSLGFLVICADFAQFLRSFSTMQNFAQIFSITKIFAPEINFRQAKLFSLVTPGISG